MTRRYVTKAGSVVLTERDATLPLVGLGVSLRTGALHDPIGKEGLVRLLGRAMRMGTGTLRATALEEKLDELGAQLSISVSQSYVHVGGVVVAASLEPFIKLLADVLIRPALRESDVRQVRRELRADLTAMCDDDRTLCFRHFRAFAFPNQLVGRPRTGTLASLSRVTRKDLLTHHKLHVTGENAVIGVWGDFHEARLHVLLEKHFGGMAQRTAPAIRLAEPVIPKGRRILIVDKPERSQVQIAIGTLGSHPSERWHLPLIVGNVAFGGLFSSRLNHEVRAKRGLSYGASSGLTLSRTRDLWSMHTFPAAKDARACIELQLGLFDAWTKRGITAAELKRAKDYLIKSHAFELDTPGKRLDQHLDVELLGWPKKYHSHFMEHVKAVTLDEVNSALHKGLALDRQVITVVATAEELLPELEKLRDVAHIEVVPFDKV